VVGRKGLIVQAEVAGGVGASMSLLVDLLERGSSGD